MYLFAAFDLAFFFLVLFLDLLDILPLSQVDMLESLDGSLGSSSRLGLLKLGVPNDNSDEEEEEEDELSSPPDALSVLNGLVISFQISSFMDILRFCSNNSFNL